MSVEAASVIAILLVVFATGGFTGALLSTRKTRKTIRELNQHVCYAPEALAELRDDMHRALASQAELCVEAATDLYRARQDDVTRYANALNANLQLLNELVVAVNLAGVASTPQAVEKHLEDVRKITKEMRGILSAVSFDDLNRCIEALKSAQERELNAYQAMAKLPKLGA